MNQLFSWRSVDRDSQRTQESSLSEEGGDLRFGFPFVLALAIVRALNVPVEGGPPRVGFAATRVRTFEGAGLVMDHSVAAKRAFVCKRLAAT